MPGNPDFCLASMGVYLFNTPELVQQVNKNFKSCPETDRDFGRNIIPAMIREKMVYAHDFKDENKKPQKYWRDIGTRDAYWEANMDLVEVDPVFNLYDPDWPIRTAPLPFPPAKTVFNELGPQGRRGEVLNSLISPGCIISGGHVERSILSPNVRVEEGARVTESIIMDDCTVGRAATVHRAIIDKGVHVPDRTTIGLDRDADSRRYTITTKGIVIVPRGMQYT
jgi:glucose-1-phosphate adenylyltransferase